MDVCVSMEPMPCDGFGMDSFDSITATFKAGRQSSVYIISCGISLTLGSSSVWFSVGRRRRTSTTTKAANAMAMAAAPTARPSTNPPLLAVERFNDVESSAMSGAAVGGVFRDAGKDVAAKVGAVEASWVGARDAGDFVGEAGSTANGAIVGVISDTGKDVGARAGAVEASLVGARDVGNVLGAADSGDNATKGAVVGRGKDTSAGVGAVVEASLVGARVAGMSEALRGGSRHELEKFNTWD
jgi:hypothetical protein